MDDLEIMTGSPGPEHSWGRCQDLPGSWGSLSDTCPAPRPRRDFRVRPSLDPSVSPSIPLRMSAPRTNRYFGAQLRGLHPRCLRSPARVTPMPRKIPIQPVASLLWTGLVTCRDPSKVSVCHQNDMLPPFQALPGALGGAGASAPSAPPTTVPSRPACNYQPGKTVDRGSPTVHAQGGCWNRIDLDWAKMCHGPLLAKPDGFFE